MLTSTTAVAHTVPSVPPATALDPFDATAHARSQRAATEGRLEQLGEYTIAGPSIRLSLINIVSGLLGFISFIVAVPLTVANVLAKGHHTSFELTGGTLGALIVLNLLGGYLSSIAHQGLHVLLCRFMRGNATLTEVDQYIYRWRAVGQAFSRRAYLVVLLVPFVAVTVLWLLIMVIAPVVAAFLIVPLVVNSVASGADLWLAWAVRQQPVAAALYLDTQHGFVTYRIVEPKSSQKKVTTPVTTGRKGKPSAKR